MIKLLTEIIPCSAPVVVLVYFLIIITVTFITAYIVLTISYNRYQNRRDTERRKQQAIKELNRMFCN